MVTIKYFASLRQQLGEAEVQYPVNEPISVSNLWQAIHGEALPATLRAAINHDFAMPDDMVKAGDEVAFFPPVTGG